MGFYENLSLQYNTLTKQGKRLAEYIRENPYKTIKMTSKALGGESGTSAATVVRLCQQLGYESFEQMKISLALDGGSDELNSPIDTIISAGDAIPDIAQKLCQKHMDSLRETLTMLNYNTLQKVVAMLQRAKTIYLFGIGSSGLAAQELCHRLNRIGKPCIFLLDGHTNLEYSAIADKKDLIIGFSYSGETKEVYLAAKNARKKGVPIVAVTRDRVNPLSACADIILTVPDSEKRVRVGAFASITSQMLIADMLYMSLLQQNFNQYENMLVETSRVANRLRE